MSERDDVDRVELEASRKAAERRSAREWIRQARNRLEQVDTQENPK